MTATDARSLAHELLQHDDASLIALLIARGIAPGVAWNDAFDAAEALLDPASIDRALTTLTADEANALAAAGAVLDTAAGAVLETVAAVPVGPVRAGLHACGLVDGDGIPYAAVGEALASRRRRDAVVHADPPVTASDASASDATSRDATAAERAFASVGSLADILHTALAVPLARIGTGALGATDRRRLIEAGAVDDTRAADELVAIAERAGLLAAQARQWLVTPAGARWLRTATETRWTEVAVALRESLPAAVRTPAGGWLPLAQWPGAYPFSPSWPDRAQAEAALLLRWGLIDAAGAAPGWAAPLAAGAEPEARALQTLLPTEVDRVYLQNDLTAISPGPLRPDLDVRLRSMAHRESRAQASTYRFTADTLSDALTAGETPDSIRDFLADVSLTGVPQPLAYEIERTARRHGALQVGPDGQGRTRITSDDDALLRTVAVDQALRPLGLVPEGSGLVTRSGADTAFSMIADARYPVVAVDADGTRRSPDRHRLASAGPALTDPADAYRPLIARLRAAHDADADKAWLGRELEQAVRARVTIIIAVELPDGTAREFTMEATGLGGGRLRGLDKTVDVERTLPVSSIRAVRPAPGR